MEEKALQDLPPPVLELVLKTLEIFVKSGPKGLAERKLFRMDGVPVAEENCADFGGRFRMPPLTASVYVYKREDIYELDLPLWLEGEHDRNDLFIFLEVDPSAGTARMTDLYVP